MADSKKYSYDWEEYEEGNKDAKTMVEEILADPELPGLSEVIIGCWGESWDNSAQAIIDGIIENKDKFSHIKSLFVGDMDFEECEVSWIEQGNYEGLWAALPQLEKLTIKGSTNLSLGKIEHENLKSLEIICGGLPKDVLASIGESKLPNLEKLALYIGVEDYGFDGDISDIKGMLDKSDFPKLKALGIKDSEIQDEVVEVVMACKYIDQVELLELCYGTLTDKGGEILLNELPKHKNIKMVDLEYHYMSEKMMDQLDDMMEANDMDIQMSDPQEEEEWDGEIWRYPMLTE
nr:STM4015 family protein [Eubacterium sp.]